jgi:predicted ATPase
MIMARLVAKSLVVAPVEGCTVTYRLAETVSACLDDRLHAQRADTNRYRVVLPEGITS